MEQLKHARRRYAGWLPRLPATALALAVGVGLCLAAGLWYTTARREELTAGPVEVATAAAEELPVTEEQREAYHVLSAARTLDVHGEVSGYVIITAMQGYKSLIRVQSTFSVSGERLAGMRVLSQNETEYLGERVATEDFAALFAGRKLPVKLWGSAAQGSPVDGLSGATISSQAVIRAVNNAHAFLMEYRREAVAAASAT